MAARKPPSELYFVLVVVAEGVANRRDDDLDVRKARAALRARESPLPWPWEAHCNDAGALYFHNRETGESEWTLPDELLARETPSGSAQRYVR